MVFICSLTSFLRNKLSKEDSKYIARKGDLNTRDTCLISIFGASPKNHSLQDEFVLKPFNIEVLQLRVENIVRTKAHDEVKKNEPFEENYIMLLAQD